MAQQTFLITGASGFIGGRLRDALLDAGQRVVAVRRKGSPPAKSGESREASYDDVASLTKIMEEVKPDVVFHVAGVTKGVTYHDFYSGNVMPTENLLRALRDAGHTPKRFVLISSLAAHGPAKLGGARRESDPSQPVEHYGRSKLRAEEAVERSSVPWTILCPSGVYGPGDVDFFEVFRGIRKRVNLFFGNRHSAFSAIYVDDCVRAILMAAESEAAIGKRYFLCDDEPTTWGEFQKLITEQMPHRVFDLSLPGQVVDVAARFGELATRFDGKARVMNRQKAIMGAQPSWVCSGEKAREELGFECEISQRDGVRRTDSWYLENGWY